MLKKRINPESKLLDKYSWYFVIFKPELRNEFKVAYIYMFKQQILSR